jgi:hypothetical protein
LILSLGKFKSKKAYFQKSISEIISKVKSSKLSIVIVSDSFSDIEQTISDSFGEKTSQYLFKNRIVEISLQSKVVNFSMMSTLEFMENSQKENRAFIVLTPSRLETLALDENISQNTLIIKGEYPLNCDKIDNKV